MRTDVLDRMVNFRMNGVLLQDAGALARRNGMSLSEFLRAAVRREVRDQ